MSPEKIITRQPTVRKGGIVLIPLVCVCQDKVYINPEWVTVLNATHRTTIIHLVDGSEVEVKQDIDDVAALLSEQVQ